MVSLRNSLIALMFVCVGLQIAACNSLALTGDKRYKAEVNAVLLSVSSDLDKDGAISAYSQKKVDALIAKYEKDYGGKASFMKIKEMNDLLKAAAADTSQATQFRKIEEAKQAREMAESYLTTEIKE
jgi:hypothetical protein